MTWLKENRLIILMDYINLIFILKLMTACYKIQKFNYWLVTILFVAVLGTYWLYHELLGNRRYKWIITLSIFIAAVSGALFKKEQILYFFSNTIVANFNNINNAIYNSQFTYFYQFKPFIFIFLPVILLTVMALNSKGFSNSILFLTVSVLIFFWYLEFTEEVKETLVTFVIISLATYSINAYEKNLKHLIKHGTKVILERNRVIVYIIAYSIIIGWIGVFLPQQYEGNFKITGEGAWRNPFGPEVGGGPLKGKQAKYGLSTVGYNNTEKKLGGPIELTNKLVFRVNADKPYYLKGEVKELYTGNSWKKEAEEYEKRSDISELEVNKFLGDLLGYNRDRTKKFMSIYPDDTMTNTIFVPSFVQEVNSEKGNIYYEKNAFTFLSSEKNVKEFVIDFYDPNDVINAVRRRSSYRDTPISKANYGRYLQISDSITARTVELVNNIIKDSRNNMEKVERIREYLSANYPYSLKVTEVPENVDFVDYFLFTEKKGYCVYFASAMTMMTRIAGIPSRYVEGFKMPDTSLNGIYQVTSEQAHAWTEVLIRQNPDIWMTVDCSTTPAEERQRLVQEQRIEVGLEEPVPDDKEIDIPERQQDLEEDISQEENSQSQYSGKIIISISISFILLSVILLRLFIFRLRKKRMINSKSVIPIYKYFLKRAKLIGVNKSEYNTDLEFAGDIYDPELKERVTELVNKVYEEFYGGVLDESYDKYEFYRFLEGYILQRQNKIKYYLTKFLI